MQLDKPTYAELAAENEALRKTVSALIRRADSEVAEGDCGYQFFQQNAALHDQVRRQTAELRDSRRRAQLAMLGSSDGYWDLDPISRQMWVSHRELDPSGEARLVWTKHHAANGLLTAGVHPDDAQHVNDAMRAHLEDRVPYDVECRALNEEGEYRWLRCRGQAVWNGSGTAVRMAGSFQDIHDRKAAEAELHAANEEKRLLALVAEYTDNAVVITDRKARVEWVNRGFTRISGYTLEEIRGKVPGHVLQGKDTDPKTRQLMSEGVASGAGFDTEVLDYDKQGRPYWIAIEFRPILSPDGEVERFIAIERDITEEKKRDRRLRLLESSIENATEAMFTIDAEGYLVDVNNAACQRLKYTREELLTMGVWDIDPDIKQDQWSQTWSKIKQGKLQGFVTQQVAKDGEVFPVAIYAGLAKHEGKEYSCAFARDISQQLAMEADLDGERRLLATIVSSIPYYVFWKDRECRFMGCNNAMAELGGLSDPEQIVGLTDYDMPWSHEISDGYRADDAEVMNSGMAKLHIEEKIGEGGQESIIDTSKVPLRDPEGNVIGVIGIFVDITERRRLEAQLVQAQKLESIGQLAAGIAHEINTPAQYVSDNTRFLRDEFQNLLRVLDHCTEQIDPNQEAQSWDERYTGVTELLQEVDYEFLRGEIPQAISQSLEGLERITRIVKAMKEFSHPGSDTKQLADLNKAIDSTITVCNNRWKYVADMEMDLEESIPAVPCLLAEFNQVILNLVVNAADAIEQRFQGTNEKGLIRVVTRQCGEMMEVRIEDNGGGIPERVRAKIFDPFFTTKEVGKGTGQGLAISRDVVVNKHGGTLECESNEGEGTVFTIRLPLSDRVKEAA